MTNLEFQELLQDALGLYEEEGKAIFGNIMTYEDAAIMTNDNGLVVNIGGQEFYITIKK